MGNLSIVTTFSADGFHSYAERMLRSLDSCWPAGTDLHLYVNGDCPVSHSSWVPKNANLWLADVTQFTSFAQARVGEKMRRGYNYKWDAIKFAHKPLAIHHALHNVQDGDVLVFLDADTFTHSVIPDDFLQQVMPNRAQISYLGREGMHSECGFLAIKVSKHVRAFWALARQMYLSKQIFDLPEWHDCAVFDFLREKFEKSIRFHNLSPWGKAGQHVFINSILGAWMDHMKGPRKAIGRSQKNDLLRPREEPYWKK